LTEIDRASELHDDDREGVIFVARDDGARTDCFVRREALSDVYGADAKASALTAFTESRTSERSNGR